LIEFHYRAENGRVNKLVGQLVLGRKVGDAIFLKHPKEGIVVIEVAAVTKNGSSANVKLLIRKPTKEETIAVEEAANKYKSSTEELHTQEGTNAEN
jgi:hypothetical protein